MRSYQKLMLENKAWAREMILSDPEYFKRLSTLQKPEFLWIGCSDSRVPANEITGTQPGEIFVQRNVANLVVADDLNLLTVLEYAVVHLKVKHVIVCGHYGCGGVLAAMGEQDLGIINNWLINIKQVRDRHHAELNAIADPEMRANRLVELNVAQQVENLAKTEVIQRTWAAEQRPQLHGWVYSLNNGILKELLQIDPSEQV